MHFVLALLMAVPAMARWATPPEVGSALQEYNMAIEAEADGSSTTVYEQIWRVQTEEGKINGSVREIEYNAYTDKVELIEAKTVNGRESIAVAPSAIEDRDKGEARDYDPVKVKSLVYPQVQIGSILVLKYKVRTTPAPIPGQWSMHFVFPIGVLVEKLSMTVHSVKPIVYDLYDPQGILSVHSSKNSLSAKLKHLIPGQVIGEKDSIFHPSRFTTLVITTEPNWHKYYSTLTEDFKKILEEKLPPPLEKQVKVWSTIADPEKQLTQILEYISRQYRYFGDWRRVRGGLVPRHLAEIEKSRYGDCKDLSTILTAILRHLNYNANVSLIDREVTPWLDRPAGKIADVGTFNHAITRAEKDGHVWWLDATNAVVSLEPYADIASRYTWVLAADRQSFDRTPPVKFEQYDYSDNETYNFLTNGDVKVDATANYNGLGAFRLAYGLLTSPREKMLFDIVDYFSDGQDLKDFKFIKASPSPDADRRLRDLHFDFVYWTPSATYQTPVGLFMPLKDGSLSGAFYETQGRESDLQLSDTPLLHHSRKILRSVKGIGENVTCEIKSRWMDLKRKVIYGKSDIEITQEAVVRIPVIQQKEYSSPEFLELRKQAQKCFYRTGLIFNPLNNRKQ